MIEAIQRRIDRRLEGEKINQSVLTELTQTIIDRLLLRLGVDGELQFPESFRGIAAEAAVKAYRRIYYEGISSEAENGIVTTSFVDDILAEYQPEITAYRNAHSSDTTGRTIRFL